MRETPAERKLVKPVMTGVEVLSNFINRHPRLTYNSAPDTGRTLRDDSEYHKFPISYESLDLFTITRI